MQKTIRSLNEQKCEFWFSNHKSLTVRYKLKLKMRRLRENWMSRASSNVKVNQYDWGEFSSHCWCPGKRKLTILWTYPLSSYRLSSSALVMFTTKKPQRSSNTLSFCQLSQTKLIFHITNLSCDTVNSKDSLTYKVTLHRTQHILLHI